MGNQLANLSTKEETSKRFDNIEAMLIEMSGTSRKTNHAQQPLLTGKRKEASQNEPYYHDEEGFLERSALQPAPIPLTITNDNSGAGDHTNSHLEIDANKPPVK
jgi:hypothetical protein